jgi:hypothetical protein
VKIEVERFGSLEESLRAGQIRALKAQLASQADVWISQYAKSLRKRDARLAWNITLNIGITGLRRIVNR